MDACWGLFYLGWQVNVPTARECLWDCWPVFSVFCCVQFCGPATGYGLAPWVASSAWRWVIAPASCALLPRSPQRGRGAGGEKALSDESVLETSAVKS